MKRFFLLWFGMLLGIAAYAFFNEAHASFPAPGGGGWRGQYATECPTKFSTPEAAALYCLNQAGVNSQTGEAITGCTTQDATTKQCTYTGSGGGGVINALLFTTGTCPANSTGTGTGVCTCTAGYVESGATCVSGCPAAGLTTGAPTGQISGTGTNPAGTICFSGCKWNYGFRISGAFAGVNSWSVFAPYNSAADSCGSDSGSNTPATAAQAAPTPCTIGTCPGTVNGVAVCLACVNASTAGAKTNVANAADGSGTSTVTTTTTTVNDNEVTKSTTTAVTTYGAGGASPTTVTTTAEAKESKQSFCEENPQLQMCRDSTFGGSCTGFSCSGDAIQCAMAREQHTKNCVLFTTTTALSTSGADLAAGTDALASTLPQHASQLTTVPVGTIVNTQFLAPGTLTDQSFTVAGHSLVIPWSQWNAILGWLSYIVLAFGYLAAYKIVGVH